MVIIDRRRYRDNMEFCLTKLLRIRRKFHRGVLDHFITHFICRVDTALIQFNLLLIEIKTYHLNFSGESNCNRHTHITQAHQ